MSYTRSARPCGNGTAVIVYKVRGLPCQRCQTPIALSIFYDDEPWAGCCPRCRDALARQEDDRFAPVEPWTVRPVIRYMYAECEPGRGTDKIRRSQCRRALGDGENADGCWDNVVRALEGD